MRKYIFVLILVIALSVSAYAQRITVSGSFDDDSASCAAAGDCVVLGLPGNVSSTAVQVSGTFVGTVAFEGTLDGTNWVDVTGYPLPSGVGATTATAGGLWQFNTSGMTQFRVRPSAFTNGPIDVMVSASSAAYVPPAAVSVGAVTINDSGSDDVSDDATDSINVRIAADAVGIGGGTQYDDGDIVGDATFTLSGWTDGVNNHAVSDTNPMPVDLKTASVAVTGTFWQATQPVSGTVTSNAGTNLNTSALALESGGNLAAAVTSLGNLDNSVDGNYLNVNLNLAGADNDGTHPVYVAPQTSGFVVDFGANNGVTASQTGTWTVTQSGTWSTRTQDGSGNVITSTSNALDVNVKSGITVDPAHGAADTGNPIKTGGYAAATEPAQVDAADRANATYSTTGFQAVNVGSLPQDRWQANSASTPLADTTAVLVIAHTDNLYTVVSNFSVVNSDATVGTRVRFISGTGTVCGTGTATIWSVYAAAVGGGEALANPEGIFAAAAASDDICIIADTTSAEITWSVSGFKSTIDRVP